MEVLLNMSRTAELALPPIMFPFVASETNYRNCVNLYHSVWQGKYCENYIKRVSLFAASMPAGFFKPSSWRVQFQLLVYGLSVRCIVGDTIPIIPFFFESLARCQSGYG